jgi:hypothetical protein
MIRAFLSAALAVTAATIPLPDQDRPRPKPEKMVGTRLDFHSTATRPRPVQQRPTQTSEGILPPIRVKALIRPGGKLSDKGTALLRGPARGVRNFATQGILRDARTETIREAIGEDAVRAIEFERPKQNRPLPRLAGDPNLRIPFNLDARRSHAVPEFEATFHNGKGAQTLAAVFDGGTIRPTHVEFATNRITVKAPNAAEDRHSTHVGGTMAARGQKPQALGMAPALKLLSYDWTDDLATLETIADQIQVSNHSYGPICGWTWNDQFQVWLWTGDTSLSGLEDAGFGKYSSDDEVLDGILANHPTLLTVCAAGNDRNDGPEQQPVFHYVRGANAAGEFEWQLSSDVRNLDGFDNGGFDTVAGLGVSKNALCVGALHDLFSEGEPIPGATIQTTPFSSWGPTDDGRVKPDLVANGESLLSPTVAPPGAVKPDEAYMEMSGTSMASPTAAGIACVVGEFFKVKFGRLPDSSELKAILIHSAVDAGPAGPDPMFGWGMINAFRAGELIAGQSGTILPRMEVENGKSSILKLDVTGAPVRATVVWIDPPGVANTGGLDDPTPVLQNNLDVVLRGPDGQIFFPYRLAHQGANWLAMKDGPNTVDNVEMVDATGSAGAWELEIKGTELRVGTKQSFAVVISGATVHAQ